MNKIRLPLLALGLGLFVSTTLSAQDTSNIRRGWTFGILPSVAYDADLGFQYGALTNIYYFGDGAVYPDYYHSFYAEAAYTTKRYGLFRLSYDSKYLIPNHRLSVDLTYLPDQMCDFYGFNGYETYYKPDYSEPSSALYKPRAYYKFKRDMLELSTTTMCRWDISPLTKPTAAFIPTFMEASPSTPATASRIPDGASMPTHSLPTMPERVR